MNQRKIFAVFFFFFNFIILFFISRNLLFPRQVSLKMNHMIPRNFRQNLIYFLARKLLQISKEGLTFEKETITIKCHLFYPE